MFFDIYHYTYQIGSVGDTNNTPTAPSAERKYLLLLFPPPKVSSYDTKPIVGGSGTLFVAITAPPLMSSTCLGPRTDPGAKDLLDWYGFMVYQP